MERIQRIRAMEEKFDTLSAAVTVLQKAIDDYEAALPLLQELTDYYTNGQWLADYEADEAGLLGCFRTTDPLSMEQLHELTGLSTGELTALLVGLELAGKVRLLPGNRYMKLCD